MYCLFVRKRNIILFAIKKVATRNKQLNKHVTSLRRRRFEMVGCADGLVRTNALRLVWCRAPHWPVHAKMSSIQQIPWFRRFLTPSRRPINTPASMLSRDVPKYHSFRELMWLSSSLSVPAILKSCSVVRINFQMHLFSKAWTRLSASLFNVHAPRPYVMTKASSITV